MINILEQNVPTTASIGFLGEEGTSNNRTDTPDFEKNFWFFTPFKWQRFSDYLDTNKILLTTLAISPNQFSRLERSLFGWSSLINHLDSEISFSHFISASVTSSLADEITLRKFAFTPEVDLTLYERALAYLTLMTVSMSGGLTQATALRKIDELKNLPEDWDSYGANTISADAIAKAKSVVTSVMKAFGGFIGNVVQLTDVIPIADGGVQLEWVGPHAELEVEISPSGVIGLLYISISEDRRYYEESKDNSLNDVYAAIARLTHSQPSN